MSHDGYGYSWPDAASHRVRVAERCANPDCGALVRDLVSPFEPELAPSWPMDRNTAGTTAYRKVS